VTRSLARRTPLIEGSPAEATTPCQTGLKPTSPVFEIALKIVSGGAPTVLLMLVE
jgi:hypothetical protein